MFYILFLTTISHRDLIVFQCLKKMFSYSQILGIAELENEIQPRPCNTDIYIIVTHCIFPS